MEQSRNSRRERTLYILLLITAAVMVAAMLYIHRSGTNMVTQLGPRVDAVMEIGVEVTQGHVWLMESVLEQEHISFDSAVYHMGRADKWVHAMLHGGTVDGVTIQPVTSPDIRSQVARIGTTLNQLSQQTFEHLIKSHGDNSDVRSSHGHDPFFTELLNQAAEVEHSMRKMIDGELAYFRHAQTILISTSLGFFLLVALVFYRYMAEVKSNRTRIKHLNLVLRAVRNVTQLITRESDRRHLIKKTCDLLVETRGFHNAWITLVDDSGRPSIWAEAGLAEDFGPAEKILTAGELAPCCQQALATSGLVVINDPPAECPRCPLAQEYTGRAGLATRLEHHGKIYGYMVVSTPKNYADDAEEQQLYSELADDLALRLHLIAVEEERQRVEQALRSSEERYRTLAANIPGSDIFLFDHDLRFLLAEGTEMKANARSKEFYEGKTVFETWKESAVRVMEPSFRKTLAGEATSSEFDCCGKNYSLYTVPLFDDKRRVTAGLALTVNVTERKRDEAALRLTQFSIDRAADAVFWVDHSFQFIRVNETACRMLGYSAEELCRLHLYDVSPSLTAEQCERQWWLTKETGSISVETVQSARDGRVIPVEINYSYMPFSGKEYLCGFVRDITERKRAEVAIRESEEKFRMISEQSLMGIAVMQNDIIKYANSAALEIFEIDSCNKCDPSLDTIRPLVHPEDLPLVVDRMQRKQTGPPETDGHYTIRVVPQKGRLKWVDVYSRTVSYEGQPAEFITMVDVTDRKRSELVQSAHLRISEATNTSPDPKSLLATIHQALGTLMDTTNFYVALYDSKRKRYTFPYCIDQNDKTDFTPDELRKSLTDYVRRTGQPLLVDQETHDELERQGEITLVGVPSPIWMGVPLRTANGVLGVMVLQSYVDKDCYSQVDLDLLSFVSGYITMALERKLAEQALRASEERFRAMYEQASVGVALLSLDGRWLTVNERLCQMVGYSSEELLRMTADDIAYSDDTKMSTCILDSGATGDLRHCNCEKRFVRKDGSQVWLNISAALVSEQNDGNKYHFAVLEDITERKRAESMVTQYTEQLVKANRELEGKQAELEDFIYTVSHDLKAPVVSISGFSSMIGEKYSEILDETGIRYLDRIRFNAEVMEELLSDLLELSRIDRAEESSTIIDFDLLADDTIESFAVAATGKDIKLRRVSHLPNVNGRHHRIRQLMTNLVDNAIKYMPHREQAVVEIGFEPEAVSPSGIAGAFFVRDNGVGIPEEFHDRIFGMFQRVGSNGDQADGSGVGLAVVKRIVEKHGGEIWLESELDEGSTFYFTLPLLGSEIDEGSSDEDISSGLPAGANKEAH